MFFVRLVTEVCTSQMFCGLEGSNGGRRGEEIRKHRTVVPDVTLWNVCFQGVHCFVKCICT